MVIPRKTGLSRGAFSLVEALIAVAVLAVIAAISTQSVVSNREKMARQKLENDVRTINAAIQVFRVSGGSLSGISSPAEIVSALQADTEAISAEQTAGLTGSRLDGRLVPIMQSAEEALTGAPRAVWDAVNQRLEVVFSGPAGVKSFALSEEAATQDKGEVVLEPTMKLAVVDPWIWDYDDAGTAAGKSSPTAVPTHPTTTSSGTPPPSTPFGSERLQDPVFSIPTGSYPIGDFDLSLFFSDPNPVGTSKIVYSVNGGVWMTYADGTAITLIPESRVVARAESLSPDYYASRTVKKSYRAKAEILREPAINVTAGRFDYSANRIITVELVNTNSPDVSRLQYSVNRDGWQDYTGWLLLNADDYPKGAKVRARAVSTAEYYEDSSIAETIILRAPPRFSGSTVATLSDPAGGPGMVTNLLPGVKDSFFRWGTAYASGEPPSSIGLKERTFSGVEVNERFTLTTMEYYNGTIRSNTGADSVQLNVELSFDSGQLFDFNFTLNLINTPNSGVSPEEAADIVQLAALASSSTALLNGEEFYLVLEFGETSANGFSEVNEFRVLEDAKATGNLYATLIPANDLDGQDPYYFGDDIFVDDPETEYAPILLALDSTIFHPGLSSIKETAIFNGFDADYLLNEDLKTTKGNPWLRWSEEHAGDEILLPGASLSPHGWFSLPGTAPWSAEDFALGNVPQGALRKVAGVEALTPQAFLQMAGREVVAVIYDKEISINEKYGTANLKGERLGRLAFTILGFESTGGLVESSNSDFLWDVRIRIEPPIETSIYDLDPWSPPTIIPSAPSGGGANGLEMATFISV